MSGGTPRRAEPRDFERINYQDLRLSLLSEWKDCEEEVEWLIRAGAYLRACWLAEAHEMGDQPLDEDRTKHLWDEFSREAIATTFTNAELALRDYTRRHTLDGFFGQFRHGMRGVGVRASLAGLMASILALRSVLSFITYHLRQMWNGLWHALGVMFFGGLLLLAFPDIAKSVWHYLSEMFEPAVERR
jgi:hypothetical protein